MSSPSSHDAWIFLQQGCQGLVPLWSRPCVTSSLRPPASWMIRVSVKWNDERTGTSHQVEAVGVGPRKQESKFLAAELLLERLLDDPACTFPLSCAA